MSYLTTLILAAPDCAWNGLHMHMPRCIRGFDNNAMGNVLLTRYHSSSQHLMGRQAFDGASGF